MNKKERTRDDDEKNVEEEKLKSICHKAPKNAFNLNPNIENSFNKIHISFVSHLFVVGLWRKSSLNFALLERKTTKKKNTHTLTISTKNIVSIRISLAGMQPLIF